MPCTAFSRKPVRSDPSDPSPLTFPLGDFLSADPYLLLGDKPPLARATPVPMALNDIWLTLFTVP